MSRTLLVLVALLLSAPVVVGQETSMESSKKEVPVADPVSFASHIQSVMVYPDCARVTRTAKVQIKSGEQTIKLVNVPQGLWDHSVMIKASHGAVRIRSVTPKVTHINVRDDDRFLEAKKVLQEKDNFVQKLNGELAYSRKQLQDLRALQPVIPAATEKDGKPFIFDMNAASSCLIFVSSEMTKTQKMIRTYEQQLEDANLELMVARNNYWKVASYNVKSEKVLEVNVSSTQSLSDVVLTIDYMIGNAGWAPCYDVRVNAENKNVDLVSYGVVHQKTGEDWAFVPVSLSTARPLSSANLPEFKKTIFSFDYSDDEDCDFAPPSSPLPQRRSARNLQASPMGYGGFAEKSSEKNRASVNAVMANVIDDQGDNQLILNTKQKISARNIRRQNANLYFEDDQGFTQMVSSKDVALVTQNYSESVKIDIPVNRLRNPALDLRGLDFRYQLARPEKILSTGERHKYLLNTETLQGEFFYQIVPTVNEHAYQMIQITNVKFRPILAGPANIFYGSDFIGTTDMACLNQDMKQEIGLGVDPRVSVKREVQNNIHTVGTFSSSKRNSVKSTLKLKNNTSEPIKVKTFDVVPLSQLDKIKVTSASFTPSKGGQYDESKGIIEWNVSLPVNEEKTFCTTYDVNYPNDFVLQSSADRVWTSQTQSK